MQAVLDEAQPMVRLLWRRETEGKVFDSPERKAALDRTLREAIRAIRDPSIRRHYGDDLKEMRLELWGRARDGAGARGRRAARAVAAEGRAAPAHRRRPRLGAGRRGRSPTAAARRVLAILALHPDLVPEYAHDIEALDCEGAQAGCATRCSRGPGGRARLPRPSSPGPTSPSPRACASPAIPTSPARACRGAGRPRRPRGPRARPCARPRRTSAGRRTSGSRAGSGRRRPSVDVTRRREAEDTREIVLAPNGHTLDKEERERSERLLGAIDFSRGGGRRSCRCAPAGAAPFAPTAQRLDLRRHTPTWANPGIRTAPRCESPDVR